MENTKRRSDSEKYPCISNAKLMDRRVLLAFVLFAAVEGCMAMSSEQLFRIPKGDGDQSFFGKPILLRRAATDWFHGEIPGFGHAMLFTIVDGRFSGEFVAVTSHTIGRLEDQISKFGWASVVVFRIRNPTSTFGNSRQDFDPVGMAYVEVVH
jgi:hypothetical protein